MKQFMKPYIVIKDQNIIQNLFDPTLYTVSFRFREKFDREDKVESCQIRAKSERALRQEIRRKRKILKDNGGL